MLQKPSQLEINITYYRIRNAREKKYRDLYYKAYNLEASELEIKADYRHSSGSASCTVTISRASKSASDLTIRHREQHASGFTERIKLYSSTLSGHHDGSLKYGYVNGEVKNEAKQLIVRSDVKFSGEDSFTKITYTANII
ncbi:MAG: hypothetical protein H6774_03645 [Pseudomonadales bacterium]|nr:hypothetical protein [Pseudomonadales bacterium]